MKNYIKGTFYRIIYQSDAGYIVGLFKVQDTNNYDLEDLIERPRLGSEPKVNLDLFSHEKKDKDKKVKIKIIPKIKTKEKEQIDDDGIEII